MIPLLKAGYLAEVDGIPYWFSDVRQENYEAIKKGNASVLRLSRARMARERERDFKMERVGCVGRNHCPWNDPLVFFGGEKMIDRWTDSSLYYFVHFVAASTVNGIATIFMFGGDVVGASVCISWIL